MCLSLFVDTTSVSKSFSFSSLVPHPMAQCKGKSKAKAKKANSVPAPKPAPKKSLSGKALTASTAHHLATHSSRLTSVEPTQDQVQGPDATQDLQDSEQNDNLPSVCILTFQVCDLHTQFSRHHSPLDATPTSVDLVDCLTQLLYAWAGNCHHLQHRRYQVGTKLMMLTFSHKQNTFATQDIKVHGPGHHTKCLCLPELMEHVSIHSYESLNGNLRLVLLTQCFKQLSDP